MIRGWVEGLDEDATNGIYAEAMGMGEREEVDEMFGFLREAGCFICQKNGQFNEFEQSYFSFLSLL